jgi:hypothetical protein
VKGWDNMKKLIAMLAASMMLLTACNALTPKQEDEPDGVINNHNNAVENGKNSLNRALNGTNNNGTNPYALDENTKIKYNDKVIMLNQLSSEIDKQLESENVGVNFKVIVEAEDDNTQ